MNGSGGKVLFVIHDNLQEDNHFPLGVGYLAAILKNAGVEVEIYSMDIYHYTNEELAEKLSNDRYDLICVGFLAARFKETVEELLNVIGEHKQDAWLVLGGHGPAPISEWMLENTPADIVCNGESEVTILELLETKMHSGDLSKVQGITYRNNMCTYLNSRKKPIKNIGEIPFPAWDLFPMDKYTTCLEMWGMEPGDKALTIITSRGCTNDCSFCYRIEPGIRLRNTRNIIKEMKMLQGEYGVNCYFFNDELFVTSKSRLIEFRDALAENGLKIKYSCNARANNIDVETVSLLQQSGCTFVNVGFESMTQDVLNKMNKKTTVDDNIKAARILKSAGMAFGLNFIWGCPGDTAESLSKNVDFILEYTSYDQLRTIRPVTPYPGCELYYHALYEGMLKGPGDFFEKFKNSDLITVNFTEIEMQEMYELLFDANRCLILDFFGNKNLPSTDLENTINKFKKLYFEGDTAFRGARHYTRNQDAEDA